MLYFFFFLVEFSLGVDSSSLSAFLFCVFDGVELPDLSSDFALSVSRTVIAASGYYFTGSSLWQIIAILFLSVSVVDGKANVAAWTAGFIGVLLDVRLMILFFSKKAIDISATSSQPASPTSRAARLRETTSGFMWLEIFAIFFAESPKWKCIRETTRQASGVRPIRYLPTLIQNHKNNSEISSDSCTLGESPKI